MDAKVKTGDIVVVGSVNADIVLDVPRLPLPGETLNASRPDTGTVFPGGKGANTAVGAARMSSAAVTVRFAGMFGHDAHAHMLRKVMADAGCDLKLSSKPANSLIPTGQAFIFLQPDGQNSIIIVGGANQSWPNQIPEELKNALRSARVVMLQREIPDEINLQVARVAKAAGAIVFQDLGGRDGPLSAEMMQCVDIVAPNETELSRLADMPTSNTEEVVAAARYLQKAGIPNVLVTLGKAGSLFLSPDGSVLKHGTFSVPRVVDTTGAGDCFRAAFAVGLVEGRAIDQCLDLAAAAAGLAIQTKGAMPSMPLRVAVNRVLSTGTRIPSKL